MLRKILKQADTSRYLQEKPTPPPPNRKYNDRKEIGKNLSAVIASKSGKNPDQLRSVASTPELEKQLWIPQHLKLMLTAGKRSVLVRYLHIHKATLIIKITITNACGELRK